MFVQSLCLCILFAPASGFGFRVYTVLDEQPCLCDWVSGFSWGGGSSVSIGLSILWKYSLLSH